MLARYPVEIAPLDTTASTTLTGEAVKNHFGRSVSGAGDVNGDGYDDVIVGAPFYWAETGRAYVYLGSASGISSEAASTLTGETTYTNFGETASGAGDVNGDGYDDIIVGARGNARAYVYHGSESGVSSIVATTLDGEYTPDWFGCSVSGAGDVNGDGYDDVIVGAPHYGSQIGRVYVYLGSASGVSSEPATTLEGEDTGNDFGYSVSDAGDVNGDGYDDIMAGAPGFQSDRGRMYVHTGSASGVSPVASTIATGVDPDNYLGWRVSGAGDVNGDGYDDIIVTTSFGSSSASQVEVFLGSSSGISQPAATTLPGEGATDNFGVSVAGAGDLDGDGYGDVIVGAQIYDSGSGRAYVFSGSPMGVSSTASTTLTGAAAGDGLGVSVAGAGDVNGDCYDDVIVGAFMTDSGRGQAYVFHGRDGHSADGGIGCEHAEIDTGGRDTDPDGEHTEKSGSGCGCGSTGEATGTPGVGFSALAPIALAALALAALHRRRSVARSL